ncbi:unnamed protein product [Brassica oleracea]
MHRCLRDLSLNLGPVFSLKFGSCRAVVVTSASAAEELLTHENDVVFANRPISTLFKIAGYNNTIVTVAGSSLRRPLAQPPPCLQRRDLLHRSSQRILRDPERRSEVSAPRRHIKRRK